MFVLFYFARLLGADAADPDRLAARATAAVMSITTIIIIITSMFDSNNNNNNLINVEIP